MGSIPSSEPFLFVVVVVVASACCCLVLIWFLLFLLLFFYLFDVVCFYFVFVTDVVVPVDLFFTKIYADITTVRKGIECCNCVAGLKDSEIFVRAYIKYF